MSEEKNDDAVESKFEQAVRGMSDAQFAAAKAAVATIDSERNPPDTSSMSDSEFEAYMRKLFREAK